MRPFKSYSFRQYRKLKAPAAQEHVGPGPKMTSALWLHESQKTKLDMEGGKKSAGRGADGGLISRSREEDLAGLGSPLKSLRKGTESSAQVPKALQPSLDPEGGRRLECPGIP